ncbi:MAG: SDR family oxidoreductase [Neisseriaceae bacterium]|nr:MAG: SDR family oxidoreductase [Neisseriaceae bacterium]
METVLITGANRGVGFGFVKAYLEHGYQVIACCRLPDTAIELQSLSTEYSDRLLIEQLDVTNSTDFDRLSAKYKHFKIDILINNAGVISKYFDKLTLVQTNVEEVLKTLEINALGTMRSIQCFESNLAFSSNPRIINMASLAGAISSANGFGYAYRMSKCALNMLTACYAKENTKVISVALRPGWVKTAMGGVGANLEVSESEAKMITIINNLQSSDSGRFIDLELQDSPW